MVTPFAIHIFTVGGDFDARLPYRTGGEQVVAVGISSDCSDILLQERVAIPPVGEIGVTEDRLMWRGPEYVEGGREVAWRATVPDEPEADLLFPPLSAFARVFEQKPIFDRVLAGPDETIWVRSFPDLSYGLFDSRLPERPRVAERWSVISGEGRWLYDLTFPAAFGLRDVGSDRLFGIVVDALGVQTAAAVVRPLVSPRYRGSR